MICTIKPRLTPAISGHVSGHPRSTRPLARTMYTTYTLVYPAPSNLSLLSPWPRLLRYDIPADRVPGSELSRRAAQRERDTDVAAHL
jgi:hypothetical protein